MSLLTLAGDAYFEGQEECEEKAKSTKNSIGLFCILNI